MRIPTRVFEPNIFCLHSLEKEHTEICRWYTGLEKTILLGREMPCILEAADNLVQMMLLHFTHEEQFLEKLSVPIFERHRDANVEITAKLIDTEDGLRLGKTASVFQLLQLGKAWIKEHLQRECEEFEYEGPLPGKQSFGITA